MQAHRRAWELTHGPIPDGFLICHRCDVKLCVNPEHLFLGTPLDNMRDKMEKGRAYFPGPRNPARGDRSGQRLHPERVCRGEAWHAARTAESLRRDDSRKTKVTLEQAGRIRELCAQGMSQAAAGALFGIRQPNVSRIVLGQIRVPPK
jgi:hypothetical protein